MYYKQTIVAIAAIVGGLYLLQIKHEQRTLKNDRDARRSVTTSNAPTVVPSKEEVEKFVRTMKGLKSIEQYRPKNLPEHLKDEPWLGVEFYDTDGSVVRLHPEDFAPPTEMISYGTEQSPVE